MPLVVSFTDSSKGSTIQSRFWDFGDGTSSTAPDPTHSYASQGDYSVSLKVTGLVKSDVEAKASYIHVRSGSGLFVRGDSNGNGTVDISDARFTLNFLFNSGLAPNCLDAADTDDSGQVDISDAIKILNFLFLGMGAPARPFPSAGTDDTLDALPPCRRGP